MDTNFQNDMDYLDAHARAVEAAKSRRDDLAGDYEATPNDFDDEIEFKTLDGVQRTADRYIWFPGQLMEPRLMRSRADFAVLGGEYFGTDYPALGLSKYALFRCRITPLTLKPRPHPVDEKIVNKEVVAFEGVPQVKGQPVASRVQFVKTFPGDQLETIVFGARDNDSKGYAEITALRGREYSNPANKQLLNELQLKVFPNWMDILTGRARLPKLLSDLVSIIGEARHRYDDDETTASACDDMLASCDTYRLWGVAYLQSEGVRIRHGVHERGGYVHRYSPVAELLLEQLNMKRENLLDAPADNGAAVDKMAEAAASMARTAEANAAFVQTIFQNREAIGAALGNNPAAAAQAAAEIVPAADPVAEPETDVDPFSLDDLTETETAPAAKAAARKK